MGFEPDFLIFKIFNAVVSVSAGIVVLVMFVKALKRKGGSALLLLPFVLWLFFWQSWYLDRSYWLASSTSFQYSLLVGMGDILVTIFVVLLALLLIFKKDKPEEPPKPF